MMNAKGLYARSTGMEGQQGCDLDPLSGDPIEDPAATS